MCWAAGRPPRSSAHRAGPRTPRPRSWCPPENAQPGLPVRHDVLPSDEIACVGGVRVTSPIRTAFDLARRTPLTEAVVAVDAVAHAFGFAPRELITFGHRHLGARGSKRLLEVVRLANPLAESPMETRIRLALHADGLVAPVLQHPVGPFRLDMAYPAIRLGIEDNGGDHLTQDRTLRDLEREAYLGRAGWRLLRFRPHEVRNRPWAVAAKVREKLILAARRQGLTLQELDPR